MRVPLLRCLCFSTGSQWNKAGMCLAMNYECKRLYVGDFSCLPLQYRNEETISSLSTQQPSCIHALSEAALTHDGNLTSLPSLFLCSKKPLTALFNKTRAFVCLAINHQTNISSRVEVLKTQHRESHTKENHRDCSKEPVLQKYSCLVHTGY